MILVHSIKLEELGNIHCNRYRLLNYCINYKNEEKQSAEKLFESKFEKDIYNVLDSKGYKLTPQFKVGNYRLDFVLENDSNQKIVIECDGDTYHGIDQLEYDLNRQSVLERCGWKFVRIRASEFYFDRDKSIERMIEEINSYLNNNAFGSKKSTDKTTNNDDNYLEEYNQDYLDELGVPEENIDKENKQLSLYELDKELERGNKEPKQLSLNDLEIKTRPSSFEKKTFRYMVLFCEGISRTDIADYYNVSFSEVREELCNIAKAYKRPYAENCVEMFKKDYSNSDKYKNIVAYYKLKNM